ncbi:MAG: hypothetical protein Q8O67_27060 [Deltaproteobacteria bacterium]|nr:hypothetical protein [Deltaproteobacteria bacterium]
MKVGIVVVVVVVVAVVAGCWGNTGSYVERRFQDDHVNYNTGEPGPEWKRVILESTNVAWHNPTLAAGILVNSHCEGVKDAPLEGLTGELMMGSTEREVLSQVLKPFSGREALETIARAKIDGVLRQRALFVLKKDGCVYDVVYDAPPDRFADGLADYQKVRDGLEVGPRRDRG